jgi:hypothetical protein
MRRREVLRALLLVLGDVPASVPEEPVPRPVERGRPPDASTVPRADGAALSDAERDTLLAFAEVLVEGRPLFPSERSALLGHIEDRVRVWDGTLALYRGTVALLNRLAAAGFSTLGLRERIELVAREGLGPSPRRIDRADDAARAVRTQVVPDLIAGYYSSPAGWAVVGYGVFPGRCGDLTRYTRPEP